MKLKDYDLKNEMLKFPKIMKYLEIETKKRRMTGKEIKNFFYNQEDALKRFLLFKHQAKKYSFDCDKTRIVKEFFREDAKFPIAIDTIFSLQSIWGEIITKILGAKYRNNFLYQLEKFDLIEEKLKQYQNSNKENLYDTINEFSRVYHTIGNMSPCPKYSPKEPNQKRKERSYNQLKGAFDRNKNQNKFYDRIDLFLKCLQSENWQYGTISEIQKDYILAWYYIDVDHKIYSENTKKYKLEEFIEPNLESKVPIPENEFDTEKIEKLIQYFKRMINMIQTRGEILEQERMEKEKMK